MKLLYLFFKIAVAASIFTLSTKLKMFEIEVFKGI